MTSKVLLLDGSMSSQLKKFGYDSNEHKPHWTFAANKNLELMKKVYSSFLDLKVDIITTNTYHFGSTLDRNLNIDEQDQERFSHYFENTCTLLCDLVEKSKNTCEVWGSVGTVATMYHDLSEYNGNYVERQNSFNIFLHYFNTVLNLFHEKTQIRNLVFETIPTEAEALAALQVLQKFPDFKIVMCFTFAKDGCLRHGENVQAIAENLKKCSQVVGMGINCTDPENVLPVLKKLQEYSFQHIFVYPNYGDEKFLIDSSDTSSIFSKKLVEEWVVNGATAVGGCCGVDEDQLKHLKTILNEMNEDDYGEQQ